MILFCKVYSRSKELYYFWVGSVRKMIKIWKFIDTNEIILELSWTILDYFGLEEL